MGSERRAVTIGRSLGVEVLDHLIVTSSAFLSFKQRGCL
jgi:DNA repair protein RadC